MKAPCSVRLTPSNRVAQQRRALVPVDFSENAAVAVEVVASLAWHNSATSCFLLQVYFNESIYVFEGYDQVLRAEKEQDYRQFISPINCRNARLIPLFEEGSNVDRIIGRAAERHDVDLIVMSTLGRGR